MTGVAPTPFTAAPPAPQAVFPATAVAIEHATARDILVHVGDIYTSPAIPTTPLKVRLGALLDRHNFFGGRDAEIRRLNDLIQTPSGYVFVTGPMGIGRTALLANWMRTIPRDRYATCAHFISRADRMADQEFTLLSLCQQLVAFHRLSGAFPSRVVELRALYVDLLSRPLPDGAHLIVVLDGLDEALDWQPGPGSDLFPRPLPRGVHVVFSASEGFESSWLENRAVLGQDIATITLTAFERENIVSLLRSAGGTLAARADSESTIETLLEVSKGDPCYLRFMLADLGSGLLSEENLIRQPRGFKQYLDQWWEQLAHDVSFQRQENLDLLGILSVAKGPLTLRELAGIAPTLRKGLQLRMQLEGQFRRYLIGNADEGYALWPRFAAYLAERFLPEELADYHSDLLAYCARWREHKSAYPFAHYAAHLFESGHQVELNALISKEWMGAKFEKTHSHLAFSGDVQLAITALAASGVASSGLCIELVRNAFIFGTLGSYASNVPTKALAALALTGNEQRALDHAALLVETDKQISAYCDIGLALHKRDPKGKSVAILETAATLAVAHGSWRNNPKEKQPNRASALTRVAHAFATVGQLQRAEEMARFAIAACDSAPEPSRFGFLSAVATALAQAGLVKEAQRALDAISTPRESRMALAVTLRALVRHGDSDRAMQICAGLSSRWDQVVQWVALTDALTEAGDTSRATQAALEAEASARLAPDKWYKACLLAQAARALHRASAREKANILMDHARALGQAVDYDTEKCWALAGVVRGLAQIDRGDQALMIATTLLGDSESDPCKQRAAGRALSATALCFALNGDCDRALTLAQKAHRLLHVTHDNGNFPFEYALPEADYRDDLVWFSESPLDNIARIFAQRGLLPWALKAARSFGNHQHQRFCQLKISEALIELNDYSGALSVISEIEDMSAKAEGVALIAVGQARNGLAAEATQTAQAAITLGQSPSTPYKSDWVIVDIVDALGEAAHIEFAEAVAESSAEPQVQAWSLVALIRHLAPAQGAKACDLGRRALRAAGDAKPTDDMTERIGGAAVWDAEGRFTTTFSMPSDVIGPSLGRALSSGHLVAPISIGGRSDITAHILGKMSDALCAVGEDACACELILQAVSQPGRPPTDFLLSQAAASLARMQRTDEAREVAARIQSPARIPHTLAIMAAALVSGGKKEEAMAMVARVRDAAASIRNRPNDFAWPKIVTTLARAGLIDQILLSQEDINVFTAESLAHPSELRQLIEALMECGDAARAADLLARAEEMANDTAQRVEIVAAAATAGLRDRAFRMLDCVMASITSNAAPALNLGDILLRLIRPLRELGNNQQNAAVCIQIDAILDSVVPPDKRDSIRQDFVEALSDVGRPDEALTICKSIRSPAVKLCSLSFASHSFSQCGALERAESLAHEVAEGAGSIETPEGRIGPWLGASRAFGGIGRGDIAFRCTLNAILAAANDRNRLLNVLGQVASSLCSIDDGKTVSDIHEALSATDGWFH